MINTTIYFFNESISNFNNIILNLSMFLAFLSAVAVIATKNTIHSVLFLIGLFLSISVYLCLIDFTFIGLSYLLVYVGAVSVLFIFILMLINIRNSELLSYTSNSIPLMVIVSCIFAVAIGTPLNINNPVYNIYILYKEEWDSILNINSHITSIGNILYTNYSLWLIVTSLILLLAMVGAIVITIKPNVSKDNVEVLSLESDLLTPLATAVAICIGCGSTYLAGMYYLIAYV